LCIFSWRERKGKRFLKEEGGVKKGKCIFWNTIFFFLKGGRGIFIIEDT